MCGRFTLATSTEVVAEFFELASAPDIPPRYNIAPTQSVFAVVDAGESAPSARASARRMLRTFHWGLVPAWAKDPSIGARMINARAETVANKPSFRSAFRRRRCLIPADGFYEWQKPHDGKKGRKQPYCIRMADGRVFALAGLWERWEGADGAAIESCTIITTTPNALIQPLHDRMPVILPRGDHALWLDPQVTDAGRVEPLLAPYPADGMDAHPVSTIVNNAANDTPLCCRPPSDL